MLKINKSAYLCQTIAVKSKRKTLLKITAKVSVKFCMKKYKS